MGDVICVFRIMPASIEDFGAVQAALQKLAPARLEEEPIAFGLKALKFTTIVPEEEGAITELEDALTAIQGVQSVETVMVSRSL